MRVGDGGMGVGGIGDVVWWGRFRRYDGGRWGWGSGMGKGGDGDVLVGLIEMGGGWWW